MAIQYPVERATSAVAELIKLYPGTQPISNSTELFADFMKVCQKRGGGPVMGFPLSQKVMNEGQSTIYLVHAAIFIKKGELDAHAAVLYDVDTGQYAFSHDYDPSWPSWLTTLLSTLIPHPDKPEPNKLH